MAPEMPRKVRAESLRRSVEMLQEAGIEDWWLGWGTLLGAVRAGGVTPRDDDVDIVVHLTETPRLREALPRRGGQTWAEKGDAWLCKRG